MMNQPQGRKKPRHPMRSKWGIRIYCQARIFTLCVSEKVRELMFKKHLKIFLVSKSYLKQQASR